MLYYGCDYYPEHWPEERWAEDARFMQLAGFNVARLGEFAWALLEPKKGRYDFAWLDRAIAILAEHGIQTVLGTPTAVPPPWLVTKHPDILQQDEHRRTRHPGSRRHTCANSPAYQEHSQRIVSALAEHYADNPHVIGWQVDNEFGCHSTSYCYCDHCAAVFRRWLRARYGSLEALNATWGTAFWSAVYTAWEQIHLPWAAPADHNPSLLLDFRRFSSDSWQAYQRMQVDILRRHNPNWFITHNLMLSFTQLDYFSLAEDLDFVSWDNYPHGPGSPAGVAFNHDLMYGLKQRPFWVMEQQPGQINWRDINIPVPPGQVRLWSHQAVAHGAEGLVYFRWRACRFGQEQYHSGLLKQDGSLDRGYAEAQQVGAELSRLPHLMRPQAEVALLFDYEDLWALELNPHHKDFDYWRLAETLYRRLWAAHVPMDVVSRNADLSGYQVVIVPAPLLIDAVQAARWQTFVEEGGKLLVTFRAFVKERSNVWTEQALPAGLSDLLGLRVAEYLSIPPEDDPVVYPHHGAGRAVRASRAAPSEREIIYPYRLWAEVLQPTTAEPLLAYADGYYAGAPAAAVHRLGRGLVCYLGCWLDDPLPPPLWEALGLGEHSLLAGAPPEVEVALLSDEGGNPILFLLNHTPMPQEVTLDDSYPNLLDGEVIEGKIVIPGRGVWILQGTLLHGPARRIHRPE